MTKRQHIEAQRIKPLGAEGLAKVREIARTGYAKVNEVLVDSYSASAIVAVHDKLNPENQAKLLAMPVAKVASVAFKLLK